MHYALILLVGILATGTSYGQRYQLGAMFSGGATLRVGGTIEVTDSEVTFIRTYADRSDTSHYQFLRRTNNLVYFTDGVVTHFITISRRLGNQLGFDYDTHIVVNGNGEDRRAHLFISYYAIQLAP